VSLKFLDAPGAPARQLSSESHVDGHYAVDRDIKALAEQVSLLTVEIEHVNCQALQDIATALGIPVHPSVQTLKCIQDKFTQKSFLTDKGIPGPEILSLSDSDLLGDLEKAIDRFGLPVMLKARTAAYDGKGNRVLRSRKEAQEAIESLGGGRANGGPQLFVEKWAPFVKELAVMVARDIHGKVLSYPCVETVQKDSICHLVIAPAQIDGLLARKAQEIAVKAVGALDGAGIFGVELFLMPNGISFVSEM
jgi:phosphoribosylaminoimidazole carboxylase